MFKSSKYILIDSEENLYIFELTLEGKICYKI